MNEQREPHSKRDFYGTNCVSCYVQCCQSMMSCYECVIEHYLCLYEYFGHAPTIPQRFCARCEDKLGLHIHKCREQKDLTTP